MTRCDLIQILITVHFGKSFIQFKLDFIFVFLLTLLVSLTITATSWTVYILDEVLLNFLCFLLLQQCPAKGYASKCTYKSFALTYPGCMYFYYSPCHTNVHYVSDVLIVLFGDAIWFWYRSSVALWCSWNKCSMTPHRQRRTDRAALKLQRCHSV